MSANRVDFPDADVEVQSLNRQHRAVRLRELFDLEEDSVFGRVVRTTTGSGHACRIPFVVHVVLVSELLRRCRAS
jgi:hypothetical protein